MAKKKYDKRFVKIGAMIRSKEDDADGNPQYYIKLDKELDLAEIAEKFDGTSLQVERPETKYFRMFDAGKLDSEDELKEKVALYEEGGQFDYVKFEISALIKN